MRWVEHGFQLVKNCLLTQPKLKEKMDGLASKRWEEALARFSLVNDLEKDRAAMFE